MYARIVVTGYAGRPRATMLALQAAVDTANAAHAAAKDDAEHIAADRALQLTVNGVESRITGDEYAKNKKMRTALTSLRDNIRTHLITAGESPLAADEPPTSLSKMIAELPDAAAEQLSKTLVEHRSSQVDLNAALQALFPVGDMSRAATRWRDYLAGHTITYLGGANIINFKVASIPVGLEPSEVLKLEYRFGYARRMDKVVREAVPGLLTSTAASRMVMAPEKNAGDSLTGRNLMVTTLCAHGGADGYAKKLRAAVAGGGSNAQFAQETHNIAAQMCTTLQNFEVHDIYFPDAKLSNWVVDAPALLQIADTKSFLHSPPALYDLTHADNCGQNFAVATCGYVSDEVFNNLATPTQIHSAILGRNLYNFLTGENPHDVNPPECTEPVFSGPCGDAYKALITDLTRNPAKTRIPLAEAAQRLRTIDIILAPSYAAIEAKICSIGLLTGQDHGSQLLASVHAACAAPGYAKDTALLALDGMATRALASAQAASASHTAITAQPECIVGKNLLLPNALILADRTACIGASANLNDLAKGLATYAMHLERAEVTLPQLKELNGLVNSCRSQRFGGDQDVTMAAYLKDATQRAMKGADILSRIGNAKNVRAELIATQAELKSPGINEIHLVIQSLRTKKPGAHSVGVGAEAKANAIEAAALAVPINQRTNLIAHLKQPKVRALLDALARNYSVSGLGAVAADPMSKAEYRRVMNEIRPPKPETQAYDGPARRLRSQNP